jgi:hypothetical protein
MTLVDQNRRKIRVRRRRKTEQYSCGILACYWYAILIQNFVAIPMMVCLQFTICNQRITRKYSFKVGNGDWQLSMSSTPSNNERTTWQQRSSASFSSPSTTTTRTYRSSPNYYDTKQRKQRLNSQFRQRRKRQKMKPIPILGYNARSILEYYDMRPLEVGWRLNSLGFPLLGTLLRISNDNFG